LSWLRDPIVCFLLLGAGLAGLHLATRTEPSPVVRDTRIVVTDADVMWLAQVFRKTWSRPPTRAELQTLVERRIRDEMLYREAVALGLDEGDEALRRRLGMKLEFLAKDAGAAAEPTEAQLQAAIEADPGRYAIAPRIGFTHVFLSPDKRGAAAERDAASLLERLRKEPGIDLDTVGDGLLIDPTQTPDEVGRTFGNAFADALFELEADDGWHGPIASGYGLHLVRIDRRLAGGPAPLALVRDRVRNDVLDARRAAALEGYLAVLREKYDVELRSSILEERAE
jgi:hypothetical protein